MFSIDGLVTGLDTTSIIDGLVSIQQKQIERLNFRKQEIQFKQAAFKGIEAQLVALQGAIGALASSTSSLFNAKLVSSSDETIVTASADGNSSVGSLTVTVNQLAQAEQIASQQFASAESQISQGTLTIQVGSRSSVQVTIDDQNNTVQGLADTINESGGDVTASIVNDSSGARVLLTSKITGAANTITIDNQLGAGSNQPDFSGPVVQAAADATISIGSGPGAIAATSTTNIFEDVVEGITLKVKNADPGKAVTISVEQDTAKARESIESFVSSFNAVISYIDSQSSFDAEAEVAGPLLGFGPASNIQSQLRDEVSRIVPNLKSAANRLSSVGITFNDQGKLQLDSGKLDKALNGDIEGVGLSDVRRIFSLDGQLENPNIEFILGSDKTLASDAPYQVVITRAAERAQIAGGALGGSIVIDSSNNEFSIDIDGTSTGTITLSDGTYTADELAIHLQETINNSSELSGQQVLVTNNGGSLAIQSSSFGSKSTLDNLGGSALDALKFAPTDSDQGVDVAGYFQVDGQTETAIGKGRVLTGNIDNENTSGIQLRVSLTSSQLSAGNVTSDLVVTRGLASQLGRTIDSLLDTENGKINGSDNTFDQQVESVDASITRLTALFDLKREQLIRDFLALESSVSQLQNTGTFLAQQFGGVSQLTKSS